MKDGACIKCGSYEHFIQDFQKRSDKEKVQTVRPSNTIARGRQPQNPRNVITNTFSIIDTDVTAILIQDQDICMYTRI